MSNYLVRYGTVPEVAKFRAPTDFVFQRDEPVIVRTQRGLQCGTVLQAVPPSTSTPQDDPSEWEIVRSATADDRSQAARWQADCEREFYEWSRRIILWNLPLELIDLERTIDGDKLILYVLSERGSATTMLALQAAADGYGIIEVQAVSSQGLVATEQGGCGTGGCGCHTTHDTSDNG